MIIFEYVLFGQICSLAAFSKDLYLLVTVANKSGDLLLATT